MTDPYRTPAPRPKIDALPKEYYDLRRWLQFKSRLRQTAKIILISLAAAFVLMTIYPALWWAFHGYPELAEGDWKGAVNSSVAAWSVWTVCCVVPGIVLLIKRLVGTYMSRTQKYKILLTDYFHENYRVLDNDTKEKIIDLIQRSES